jgi:colicin import membrane protein
MMADSQRAFLLSVSLHAGAAVVLVLLSLALNRHREDAVKVFELVAGEGDNYAARAAPALGSEAGVKLKMPGANDRRESVPPPVAPATKSAAPANDAIPNFKKRIQYEIVRGDAKAKLQIRREREAEAKRLAEEKKRQALEDAKRAKAEKANPTRAESEGIAKGVVGGSVENKTGGAGGKALRNDSDDLVGLYDAMFKQRLRAQFEPPPGLSDSLKATIEVRSNADGTLTGARVTRSSGSREFDQAVLEAVGRVRMPERPDRRGETIEFIFTMRPRDEG